MSLSFMWRAFYPMLLCLALAVPANADMVFVLNSGDASISVLDARERSELRRMPALREVHHAVLTPDGSTLVVGDSGGNELIFLDPSTGELRNRVRVSNPYHLEYSPDGKYLVVASLRRDQVDIYDAGTMALLGRLQQPDKPSHIAFSPDSRFVYVTLQGTGEVVAIDLSTRAAAWTVAVGPEPAGIIWHRGRLIIGLMGSTDFVQLDPTTKAVSRAFSVGRGAHVVVPSPDGRSLYATARVESGLWEVDAETLEVKRRFDVPGGPDCISFDPDGRLWMTLRWLGRVGVLDPRTGTLEQIRVGRSPHGIFVMPRRDGMRADFAAIMPGAVSGSRPLPRPLQARQGEIPADRPVPPVMSAAPSLAPGPSVQPTRNSRRAGLDMPILTVTPVRVETFR
ncbi:beta-propeller fold lactonase family protein [Rhodovarius sp.]|jgi:YVTN family beta-propeller protein|uniref:YncE family protein n=1 Tax=Rhodovarius sp. TaxID=2972673 RepID=UPI00333EC876